MAEVVLFHHVQGLTEGVRAFAAGLRAGGHTVHTPDLFDGERPSTVDDGIALVQRIGEDVLGERAERFVAGLPAGLVYAGFSLGGATAQRYAQTRPGARGALLYEACIPLTGDWAFGPWPLSRPALPQPSGGSADSGHLRTSPLFRPQMGARWMPKRSFQLRGCAAALSEIH